MFAADLNDRLFDSKHWNLLETKMIYIMKIKVRIFQKCVVTNLPYYLENQDKTLYLDTLIKSTM